MKVSPFFKQNISPGVPPLIILVSQLENKPSTVPPYSTESSGDPPPSTGMFDWATAELSSTPYLLVERKEA